jgi:site-specific DNA-cytosine methylase
MNQQSTEMEIRHFHTYCGLGGGALGFNRGSARVGNLRARFRCIGGIDVSPAAIRDFERLSGARGTVLDLFDREQYRAFHDCDPPASWREATPQDFQRAACYERPHIWFLSAPCKGFSGLLSQSRSNSAKYQALNRLTLRGLWLGLETWADDPPELIIFENVPRIATRGRALLDQIGSLLRHYGYAVAETFHDCGEIGGLAQHRKRFLLVARHIEKVPPFLYEPPKRRVRAVGEILEKFPMPGALGIPMHGIPNLQWKTWVRLAFVEAGSDWRSLNKLRVVDGKLADYLLVPELRNDTLGVNAWDESMGTVTGDARPMKGSFSVADPRFPNSQGEHATKYKVQPWEEPSSTITGSDRIGSGALCIADPRLNSQGGRSDLYGVNRWEEPASAVIGHSSHDNGVFCVADPRLPEANGKLIAIIRALDGTWHRPFTTLELAALQSLVDPDELFDLDGNSESAKRERIGNAVPPDAAQAIADLMGQTLLMAWSGQSFALSAQPIWVQPVAVALSVKPSEAVG